MPKKPFEPTEPTEDTTLDEVLSDLAPEEAPPPPAAPAAPAAELRYRVRSSAVGRWVQGDEITAEDIGGPERAALLCARGAIEEI